jgi:hypothetical protein
MLDFRVVIAACIAGVVILFGGIGLVASLKTVHEPVRPANRIVERPRIEPNASQPVVIETPAAKPAPAQEVVRPPEPALVPTPVAAPVPEAAPIVSPAEARAPAIETTGSIAPQPAPAIPAPAIPAAVGPARARPAPAPAALPTNVPVEHPQATAELPPSSATAKKTARRPRPAAPAPAGPINPFSAIFGGFTQKQ